MYIILFTNEIVFKKGWSSCIVARMLKLEPVDEFTELILKAFEAMFNNFIPKRLKG